jgi:hypothetical protein
MKKAHKLAEAITDQRDGNFIVTCLDVQDAMGDWLEEQKRFMHRRLSVCPVCNFLREKSKSNSM